MLDKLTDLMRKQQGLMDKTLRQPQPGEGDQQSPDAQEPGNGPGETGEPNQNGLAGEQGDLAKQLEQFMRDLEKNGIQGPPSFGEAGRQMGEAKKSLEQRNRDQALGQQGDALSKLREGAQKMARDMQQKGRSGQDSSGREGEAKGDPLDPLGRPMPTTRDDFGPDKNMLPSELAIRRAREILESLRARANTPDLPKIDKDYIERLLRGLY
jgi:type II secretory pathway component PulJ